MPPGEVAFQKEGMASTKALRRGAVPEQHGCTEATQVVGGASSEKPGATGTCHKAANLLFAFQSLPDSCVQVAEA